MYVCFFAAINIIYSFREIKIGFLRDSYMCTIKNGLLVFVLGVKSKLHLFNSI